MIRLKSAVYVQALIRRCESAGVSAFLVRHGSEEAGAILIKVNRLDGSCVVLSQARRDEEAVWLRPLGETSDESRAAEYFARQLRIDPDLWIVEIEDRQGRSFVTEPVI